MPSSGPVPAAFYEGRCAPPPYNKPKPGRAEFMVLRGTIATFVILNTTYNYLWQLIKRHALNDLKDFNRGRRQYFAWARARYSTGPFEEADEIEISLCDPLDATGPDHQYGPPGKCLAMIWLAWEPIAPNRLRVAIGTATNSPGSDSFFEHILRTIVKLYPEAEDQVKSYLPLGHRRSESSVVLSPSQYFDKPAGQPASKETVRSFHHLVKTTERSARSIEKELLTTTDTYYARCKEYTDEEPVNLKERSQKIKRGQWLPKD